MPQQILIVHGGDAFSADADFLENLREKADFILPNDLGKAAQQAGQMILFHSQDDAIVTYANVEDYQRAFPDARLISFEHRGHFNEERFIEIEEVIRSMLL